MSRDYTIDMDSLQAFARAYLAQAAELQRLQYLDQFVAVAEAGDADEIVTLKAEVTQLTTALQETQASLECEQNRNARREDAVVHAIERADKAQSEVDHLTTALHLSEEEARACGRACAVLKAEKEAAESALLASQQARATLRQQIEALVSFPIEVSAWDGSNKRTIITVELDKVLALVAPPSETPHE
jgi:chromosome segregation ATPase